MRAKGRKAGRVVGWALLFAALIALVIEVFRWLRDGVYQPAAVGGLWAEIHANSLVGFGAVVEKSISPALWIDVMVPLLSLPAWLVFGLPGGVLVWFCHFRRKRRRR